jgi:hypothetical protein
MRSAMSSATRRAREEARRSVGKKGRLGAGGRGGGTAVLEGQRFGRKGSEGGWTRGQLPALVSEELKYGRQYVLIAA